MIEYVCLDDLTFENKTVLLRADMNVPMKDGIVTDNTRLTRLLPTLKDLIQYGAKIVILSHLGRPKGQKVPELSLRPVAQTLEGLIGKPVAFAEDCKGPLAQKAVDAMQAGDVLVLENTRFYAEEEANDPAFAKEIASLGDIFISDAFSTAHRAHATTVGLADYLPCGAGRLMESEIGALSRALEHPVTPVGAVIGGAKISTKLDLLHNLVKKVSLLVLGGGMANTFLAAKGFPVGTSLYEPDMLENARSIMEEADAYNCEVLLPRDVVVAPELKPDAPISILSVQDVAENQKILDLGPSSTEDAKKKLQNCRTIVWNGPLGAFETPPFDHATKETARYVGSLTKQGSMLSVAGGGDTIAALRQAGVMDQFSYVSTAGGAFLEWLEGKTLPGVAILVKKEAA